MLAATRGQLTPKTLKSPSNSETALWGEAQPEILQESPKLGLCSSLGAFGCILGLESCAGLAEMPLSYGSGLFPCLFFFRYDEHNVYLIHL